MKEDDRLMPAALHNKLAMTLKDFSALLKDIGEPGLSSSFSRLCARFEDAETSEERRYVIGQGLAFFGGMNSVNDLVVMQDGRIDVEANRRLDNLRTSVYDLLSFAISREID